MQICVAHMGIKMEFKEDFANPRTDHFHNGWMDAECNVHVYVMCVCMCVSEKENVRL